MVAFYRSVDVYVGLAQFEGFGLPPLEAMAYGSTVIAHAWSGMVDFCYEPACFRVHSAFLRKDPQFHDDGVWAVADVYHAAHVMRQVHGLYRSGVLPAAGKHARACVTAAFDYGAIVEQALSPKSASHLFLGCYNSTTPKGVSVINRTHVWKALWMDLTGVTAYECAQAAKKAKWPYFALTASGTRCIGLAAAPTQPKRNGGDHNFIADGPSPRSSTFRPLPALCSLALHPSTSYFALRRPALLASALSFSCSPSPSPSGSHPSAAHPHPHPHLRPPGPTRSMIVDTVNCRDSDAVYRLRQPLLSPAAVDTSGQAFGLLGKGKGARGKSHMVAESRGSDHGGVGGWFGRWFGR